MSNNSFDTTSVAAQQLFTHCPSALHIVVSRSVCKFSYDCDVTEMTPGPLNLENHNYCRVKNLIVSHETSHFETIQTIVLRDSKLR